MAGACLRPNFLPPCFLVNEISEEVLFCYQVLKLGLKQVPGLSNSGSNDVRDPQDIDFINSLTKPALKRLSTEFRMTRV